MVFRLETVSNANVHAVCVDPPIEHNANYNVPFASRAGAGFIDESVAFDAVESKMVTDALGGYQVGIIDNET
jgi:hypothetical protein